MRLFLAGFSLAAAVLLAVPALGSETRGLSVSDEALYRDAFAAVESKNWPKALRLAAAGENPLPGKVILWLELTRAASKPGFDALAAFLIENPDWPSQTTLRAKAELAMPLALAAARVVAWFEQSPPVSREGRIRLAQALGEVGRAEEKIDLLRRIWVEENFPRRESKAFYARYKSILLPEDHIARLDRLLWDGRRSEARRMLRVVDAGYAALGEARLRLMERGWAVDQAIAAVPASLRDDPGLQYERLRWRQRKDQQSYDQSAREILFDGPPDELGRPAAWWTQRAIFARRALEDGHITAAYRIASEHGPLEGAAFADAEWLAGWIALQFLQDASVAFEHFSALRRAVAYPISLARAGYWAGRALEQMGDRESARLWYADAAQHWQTFYGQLAGARLASLGVDIRPGGIEPVDYASATIDSHELADVVRLLVYLDQPALIDDFILRLVALGESPQDQAFIATLALASDRPDLSIRAARRAVRHGIVLHAHAWPLVALPPEGDPAGLEPALVLTVVRQESAFDPQAINPSGARGLMQLMPATARQVARAMRLPATVSQLTEDAAYNVTLGSAYLAGLIEAFDGSYLLALAAYNAGPGSVKRWIRRNGDPRDADVDAIDWIEQIPFDETRNYVQRSLESLNVYRGRLDEGSPPTLLIQDLSRGVRAPSSSTSG